MGEKDGLNKRVGKHSATEREYNHLILAHASIKSLEIEMIQMIL